MSRYLMCFGLFGALAACNCNPPSLGTSPETPPFDPVLVEPGNFGRWLSMDTDGSRVTMAYYNRSVGGLGYATGVPNADDTLTWAHEAADGYPDASGIDTVNVGKYASQRTAPDGSVWIAYQDVDKGALRVVHRTPGRGWSAPAELDAGGTWIDLEIGPTGNPVVAHCNPQTNEVRLLEFDGERWVSTQLYQGQGPVAYSRVFVQQDTIFVAFRDEAQQALMLAEIEGASRTVSLVDDEGDVGAWPSIAIDSGALAIAYHDVENQDLRLAIRTPDGGWRRSVIDDGELRGADSELFELDGQLAVVYFDGWNNDVMLARRSEEGWIIEPIGEEGTLGYHNEVAFAAGRWWAGSYDQTARTLFVKALSSP